MSEPVVVKDQRCSFLRLCDTLDEFKHLFTYVIELRKHAGKWSCDIDITPHDVTSSGFDLETNVCGSESTTIEGAVESTLNIFLERVKTFSNSFYAKISDAKESLETCDSVIERLQLLM